MGYTVSPVIQYPVIITNVEPSIPLVEGALRSGKPIQIHLISITPAFRWPIVGESWLVQNRNGSWFLDSVVPDPDAYTLFTTSNPGDMVLNTPTGVISVMGEEATEETNVDFSLFYDLGTTTLAYSHNGVVYPLESGSGGGGGTYIYTQSSPAMTWVIDHDLGYYPPVFTKDDDNSQIIGEITYVDDNTVQVDFLSPESGTAYLAK